MFDDDNTTRQALQTLNDEPGPPVATTLDDVVRRGRRRVLVQRVSAVAAVAAVVAGIGVGAVLLRSGDQHGGVQVGSTTEPSATSALPGWQVVDMPADMTVVGPDDCRWKSGQSPPAPPKTEIVVPRWEVLVSAVEQVDGKLLANPPSTAPDDWWKFAPSTADDVGRGGTHVGIATGDGTGQLILDAAFYGGTPEQAADSSVVVFGNCGPPSRRVLADGTVLQLYPVHTNLPQPTQFVYMFRPSGYTYRLISAGETELPVTETQLAAIAEELVPKLE
jgi:hypothetical protein